MRQGESNGGVQLVVTVTPVALLLRLQLLLHAVVIVGETPSATASSVFPAMSSRTVRVRGRLLWAVLGTVVRVTIPTSPAVVHLVVLPAPVGVAAKARLFPRRPPPPPPSPHSRRLVGLHGTGVSRLDQGTFVELFFELGRAVEVDLFRCLRDHQLSLAVGVEFLGEGSREGGKGGRRTRKTRRPEGG